MSRYSQSPRRSSRAGSGLASLYGSDEIEQYSGEERAFTPVEDQEARRDVRGVSSAPPPPPALSPAREVPQTGAPASITQVPVGVAPVNAFAHVRAVLVVSVTVNSFGAGLSFSALASGTQLAPRYVAWAFTAFVLGIVTGVVWQAALVADFQGSSGRLYRSEAGMLLAQVIGFTAGTGGLLLLSLSMAKHPRVDVRIAGAFSVGMICVLVFAAVLRLLATVVRRNRMIVFGPPAQSTEDLPTTARDAPGTRSLPPTGLLYEPIHGQPTRPSPLVRSNAQHGGRQKALPRLGQHDTLQSVQPVNGPSVRDYPAGSEREQYWRSSPRNSGTGTSTPASWSSVELHAPPLGTAEHYAILSQESPSETEWHGVTPDPESPHARSLD